MKKVMTWMVVAVVALSAPVLAQAPPQRPAPPRQVPLKVELVVARYQGEKKVSSLPYTLSVVANDGERSRLRMGVDMPVQQTVFGAAKGEGAASVPQTSYTYRSVGTNIDCGARTVEEGLYRLDIAVEDSSIFMTEKDKPSGLSGTPSFRKFTSSFNVLLKDGQRAQHTAATDPVSGEVLRIDVTLTVLK